MATNAGSSPTSTIVAIRNAEKEVGMMGEGYMWIITSKTTSFLDSLDVEAIKLKQGGSGLQIASRELHDFELNWRKEYFALNPFVEFKEVDPNGIWAYDAVCAPTLGVDRVQTTIPQLEEHVTAGGCKICGDCLGFSGACAHIELHCKREAVGCRWRWLFWCPIVYLVRGNGMLPTRLTPDANGCSTSKLMNGRTISKAIEVVNVIGKGSVSGWFAKEIGKKNSSNGGLRTIIWPGGTVTIPKRRRPQMNDKKLRILVPDKNLGSITYRAYKLGGYKEPDTGNRFQKFVEAKSKATDWVSSMAGSGLSELTRVRRCVATETVVTGGELHSLMKPFWFCCALERGFGGDAANCR
ncbi:hypothetical protein Ccrd_003759 [Cynara cardunculus var. scolymus]|uniref:Extracellular ligand-binding receptor n=1 Tax=Cynara cardunculus var. scolymus TaxID=59895 RepID=A0A103XNZ2_CYNCS|nr:hypothetical protein Ccrd_003759 [Cynara cardunculus var. scolymus]